MLKASRQSATEPENRMNIARKSKSRRLRVRVVHKNINDTKNENCSVGHISQLVHGKINCKYIFSRLISC